MDIKLLFITGFPRSGTTLVEKIIGNQKGAYVAHQLFPTLFLNVKEEFLKLQGISRPYPFLPNPSIEEQEDFFHYLTNAVFTVNQVNSWMMEGFDYVAMGEKQVLKELPLVEGSLIEVVSHMLQYLGSDSDTVFGFKDVMMDEFISYFEQEGMKTITVIRDPRAVIYSLINSNEMGAYRPTLFNLQVWKRGLRNAKQSNSYIVKYEDLVQHFDTGIENLGIHIGLKVSADVFPLRKNNNEVWSSNSSFKESNSLSTKSLSAFTDKLSQETISYIETICFDEMNELNYSRSITERVSIRQLKEPFPVTHQAFLNWDNKVELAKELDS